VTNIADTSLEALRKKREDGSLESDKERCLYIIDAYGPITSKEMEVHMGKNKHKFSGRINKLKENDRVQVVGTKDGHQLLEARQPLFIDNDDEKEQGQEDEESLEPGDVIFE